MSMDTTVFMQRNYKDTLAQRISRGRDIIDDFSDTILEIEHRLVQPSGANAHFIVQKDYSVAHNK